jgi:hypothetical protein
MPSVAGLFISIVIGSLVQAPFLWLAGKWIVGKEKALFREAIWIGILGAVINIVISSVAGGPIGGLAQLIAYLYLIKEYFDTGWGNAIIISIIATVIMWVVVVILGIIGIGLAFF